MQHTVSSLYNDYVTRGVITPDSAQESLLPVFDGLLMQAQTLIKWQTRRTPLGKLLKRLSRVPLETQGLYLYGDVGRGKSLLMDLLYEALPDGHKRRVHFHAFMGEVHARLKAMRARKDYGTDGLLTALARKIIARECIICFDEFQVTNIADAMILGRLFDALFREGAMIVATSNTAPDDLYQNGLQRDRFEPFIEMLSSKLNVLKLDSDTDYRLQHFKRLERSYHSPLGKKADAFMKDGFAELAAGASGEKETLRVNGRKLEFDKTHGDVLWTDFDALCRQPLGAGDYLAIASNYTTVLISDIPKLTAEMRNEATRFIALIDALYEHRCKLVCSAAAEIDKLVTDGDHAATFKRTASRLHEMQSERYWQMPHVAETAVD